MQKNLDVSTYQDGSPISYVTDSTEWASLTTGAYCYLNNDSAKYAAAYGKLYNWYAVNDKRGLAPKGWHIASDNEWRQLSNYLGGETVAGGKMKEKGTSHWAAPNTGATNSSSFTGLPSGSRSSKGIFYSIGDYIGNFGMWWTSTENSAVDAWVRQLEYYNEGLYRNNNSFKQHGFSVRCVKD